MRVVYDTNVLATILSSRSEIRKLKIAVLNDQVTPVTSSFILNELETVLVSRFGLTRQGAKARTNLLARVAEVVHPSNIEKIARDPDDDYILATALAGHATYILTHDKDLLVLKEYKGIKILTPVDFQK
jgi:uncharacterized protein